MSHELVQAAGREPLSASSESLEHSLLMNDETDLSPWWDDDLGGIDSPLLDLTEEFAFYSENFARSAEEGWFYSDVDGGIEEVPALDDGEDPY